MRPLLIRNGTGTSPSSGVEQVTSLLKGVNLELDAG